MVKLDAEISKYQSTSSSEKFPVAGAFSILVVLVYLIFMGTPLAYNIWNYIVKQKRYKSHLLSGFYFSAFMLLIARLTQFSAYSLFNFGIQD
jgi:hypothetical protein